MRNKDASALLKEAISALEIRQAEEGRLLRDQLHLAYESLKPINLIRGVFEEITSSLEIKNSLINRLVSSLTGYLMKRIFVGSTSNLLKKLAGMLIQYSVTAVVSRYSETIRALGLQMIHRLQDNITDENIKKVAANAK